MIISRALRHLSSEWRGPALVLVTWREWRPLIGAVLAVAVVAAIVARAQLSVGMAVVMYAPPVVAIATFGGVVAHARRPSVWTVLFQRPGAPPAVLARLMVLSAAPFAVAIVVLFAAVALGVYAGDVVTPGIWRQFASFGVAWTLVSFAAVAVVSASGARGVAGITVLWMLIPALVRIAARSLTIPEALRWMLEFLSPPFDASVGWLAALSAADSELTMRFLAQLVTFPTLCVCLLIWRFRRMARAELGTSN